MADLKYDLNKLEESGCVSAKDAVALFYTYQDYFNALSSFVEDRSMYLTTYNPTVVVYSDDMRRLFLEDCKKIRASFSMMGLTQALREVNNLEDAVIRNDVKSLSDGLVTYRATADIAAGVIKAAQVIEQRHEKRDLFVIDDSPETVAAISDILSERFNIYKYHSAYEAVAAIDAGKPQLFIIDINIPVINGYEIALMLREHKKFAKTPIIFLTGYTPREHVAAELKFHTYDYLSKPVTKAPLLEKVNALTTVAK